MESLDPGDFNGLLAALQQERHRSGQLAQQVQRAEEAKLSFEVELATAQRDAAVARARCRALERGSPLPAVFAQCQAEIETAHELAARLQKENADLSRAVAEAEVASLVKGAIVRGQGGERGRFDEEPLSDTSAVISTLHKRLQNAYAQIKKLQEELATQRATTKGVESAIRKSEVSKRAAEDAIKRNASLQGALLAAERQVEVQCLAAAEAWGSVEQLQAERDEARHALEAEQEQCEQLLDLVDALQLQARVGAAAWSKAAVGRLTPAITSPPGLGAVEHGTL